MAGRKKDEMEGIAPPLKCLIEIQTAMLNGEPVRVGVNRYLSIAGPDDEYAMALRRFLFIWDQGGEWKSLVAHIESSHRRALTELIAIGLSGQSIMPHLDELKEEIRSACEIQIRHELEMLPLRMLFPLLIFQFPAFLLLLFGPLLAQVLRELSQ